MNSRIDEEPVDVDKLFEEELLYEKAVEECEEFILRFSEKSIFVEMDIKDSFNRTHLDINKLYAFATIEEDRKDRELFIEETIDNGVIVVIEKRKNDDTLYILIEKTYGDNKQKYETYDDYLEAYRGRWFESITSVCKEWEGYEEELQLLLSVVQKMLVNRRLGK